MECPPSSDKFDMESTIEYNPDKRDASDPEIELHVHARQTDAGQLLARNSDSAAEGLQTDADACQAADSNVGRWPVGLSPRGDPAAIPPSAAAEASAMWCGQTAHSTPYPTITDAYYDPHPSVSGAEAVDRSSATGSEWERFVGQSSTWSESVQWDAPRSKPKDACASHVRYDAMSCHTGKPSG